jgi:hypothetical protein
MGVLESIKRVYVYECHICRGKSGIKVKQKENTTGETYRDYMYICSDCIKGIQSDSEYLNKQKYWKLKPRIKDEDSYRRKGNAKRKRNSKTGSRNTKSN